eukprot:c34031_g1_i1.p1 GENE.c34031_g1_i1~~c34031_g1_i1.p1  ORF type:complete len:165 (+),score=59.01 c34031_g1_i1:33-497(+)
MNSFLQLIEPRSLWLYTRVYFAASMFCDTVAGLTFTTGKSMEPTIDESGNILLLDKFKAADRLNRGDVVVAISPIEPHKSVCKRVIGTGGDTLWIEDSYSRKTLYTVPLGNVWLEGDNRPNSRDSREYGPVSLGLIQGRVVLRLWPINRIGSLN